MKKLNFLLALIIIGAVSFSCQKTEQEQDFKSTDRTSIQNPSVDFDKMNQRLNSRLASLRVYQEQLALAANSNRECMQRVVVPDDASTIQDAIEMVCEYGEVIVQSGTYVEDIWIFNKPGIHIRAVGNVILNGDFSVVYNSDNVIIEDFHIVVPDYPIPWDGVWLYYVNGCVIKNNIISNQAYPGIESADWGIYIWESGNYNQIKDNEVSGMEIGILIGSLNPDQTCSNNMIKGNLVSNAERGIWLVFDCDNNKVMGNQIDNSIGPVSIGISMTGHDPFCVENNQIKLNDVSYCEYEGLFLHTSFNNMIGPNNTFNYNGGDGISLLPYNEDNFVVNNEALYNTGFDIWNGGVNNKFRANTAVNTYGF